MRYGRITLSAGVAAYRYGEPLEQLLQRADRALYRAKDQGRNRVAKETDLPEEDGAGDTLVLKRPAG
jgi:diguanylate cyclase